MGLLTSSLASATLPAPPPTALNAGWKGQRVCEVLFENADLLAMRCTFPPGVGHERHWHPRHWGYVVSGGTMHITDARGTAVREIKTGSSWWSDGIDWHEARNIGSTTAVYVIYEPKQSGAEKAHPSH
jgi:quercetin dioxygenase-like cupin family protein